MGRGKLVGMDREGLERTQAEVKAIKQIYKTQVIYIYLR